VIKINKNKLEEILMNFESYVEIPYYWVHTIYEIICILDEELMQCENWKKIQWVYGCT